MSNSVSTPSIVRRANATSPFGRLMMRTKTALSPMKKVGTPNASHWETASSCA